MKIKLGLLMGILTFLLSEFAFAEESVVYKSFEVTISYDGNAAANVPTLLRLSETNIHGFLYSDVVNKSFKILDENKNILPYEIDTWNEEGESLIWVNIPQFEKGKVIEVRFGQDYSSSSASTMVWNDYVGVWHMNEINATASTYGSYPNSTAIAGIDGEKAAASVAGEPGVFGSSVRINDASPKTTNQKYGGVFIPDGGDNSPIDLGSTFAISGWLKHKDVDMYYDHIFYKRLKSTNTDSPNNAFAIEMAANYQRTTNVDARSSSGNGTKFALPNSLYDWTYVTFVYDEENIKVYQDGTYVGNIISKVCVDNNAPIAIGNNVAAYGNEQGDCAWIGWIDEVRLMDGTPSTDYLAAEYAAMADSNAFIYGTVKLPIAGLAEINGAPSLKWIGENFEFSAPIITGSGNMYAVYENIGTGVAFTNKIDFSSTPAYVEQIISDTPIFEDVGSYICAILFENEEKTLSLISYCNEFVYTGTPIIEKLSDVDEGKYIPGVFRISRLETATHGDLVMNVVLSGPAIEANLVENDVSQVIIPDGESYVDVYINPIYAPDINENLSLTITISGESFVSIGDVSEDMVVVNAEGNILIRYVSTNGSDENNGYSLETAFQTVGAALKAVSTTAEVGQSTIYVEEGLYVVSEVMPITTPTRVLGIGQTPSSVVISNKVNAYHLDGNHRIFQLDNADAFVANLTMANGSMWGSGWNSYGGSFTISENGGTVSNCVVVGGRTTASQCFAAGARLSGGLVTHTIFRDCVSKASDSHQFHDNKPGVIHAEKNSVVENCLFDDNNQIKILYLINALDTTTIRNCTIVNSSLPNTNDYCKVFAAIYAGSNATIQNVVIAGVTNAIDGAAVLPLVKTPTAFINGATDANITDVGYPETTIVGTAEQFFTDYAAGNYRPNPFGPLVGAGANYDGMALYDLSGEYTRLVGGKIDIGCYEGFPIGTVIFVK